MEEPGRPRVRGLLSKALQFRNATVPRTNMPLSISFLSHDDFQRNVERWLRNVMVNSKDMALPLFLTTRLVRKAAYPKVREFLHSHRKAETWWDATDSDKLPCCWSFLRLHYTHDVDPQQLLAVNLADLTLPKFLAVFSNVNANSTYYLSKTPFPERVQTKFQQWLRHHTLPPGLWTSFQQFMHDRYPWGFRKGAFLPYGFVFLKRKKQWAKGRTLTVQSSLSSHNFQP